MPNMEAAGIEPAQGSPRHHGWVYLIGGGWAAKVGHARNPRKRLALLQTGSPEPLKLLAVIDAPRHVEREIHELFAADRLHGEWFKRSADLLGYFTDHGFACSCAPRFPDQECFIHGEGLPEW